MKIYGVDFTSAPSPKKAITCVHCRLVTSGLFLEGLESLTSFDAFENFLRQPGPWVAGMDFPFGQPRKLIENLGWPQSWAGYVGLIGTLTKTEFVEMLAKYRNSRETGDKHHLRLTDKLAHSRSPMMLYRVPVGKMFFEGAPRLLNAGVNIQPSCTRDDLLCWLLAHPSAFLRNRNGNFAGLYTFSVHSCISSV